MDRSRSQSKWDLLTWVIVLSLLAFAGNALYGKLKGYLQGAESIVTSTEHNAPTGRLTKLRREGDSSYLWAKGSKDPADSNSEWFDMTGSPIAVENVNHGIGRDTIAAIDEPLFVGPDDPRLRKFLRRLTDANLQSLSVIGFEHAGDARAYPVALLTRHELVNDTVGGKPVTVGW